MPYVFPHDRPDYLPALPFTEREQRALRLLPRQRAWLITTQMQEKRCTGPCTGGSGECFLTKTGQPGFPSSSVIGRMSRCSRSTAQTVIHELHRLCCAAEDASESGPGTRDGSRP